MVVVRRPLAGDEHTLPADLHSRSLCTRSCSTLHAGLQCNESIMHESYMREGGGEGGEGGR